MAASAFGLVLGALASRVRAASGFRDPSSTGTGIPVLVGSQVAAFGDQPESWLCLAWSGMEGGDSAGDARQTVAAMRVPGRPREERGTIRCRARWATGDGTLDAHDDAIGQALAIVDGVDGVLRGGADGPTLGLVPGSLASLVVTVGDVTAVVPVVEAGPVAVVDFTVVYVARI